MWIGLYLPRDVLDLLVSGARSCILGTTVVHVNVSAQGLADQVAQHRRAFVIRGESPSVDLQSLVLSAVNGPSRLSHRSMMSVVLLLRMACNIMSGICLFRLSVD